MLTPIQVTNAANVLVHMYDFNAALAGFNWPNGTPLNIAWAARTSLQTPPFNLDYARQVHRWGFGGADIKDAVVRHPGFHESLDNFLNTWSANPRDPWVPAGVVSPGMQAFIDLLSIPRLGIATVSKWACFIDQSQYAIYDSRVAYALRDLLTPAGRRIFPFVPGRPAPDGHPQRVNGDTLIGKPRRAATAYINFLLVVREAASELNRSQPLNHVNQQVVGNEWTPALVEMALFERGVARTRTPGIPQVDGTVNAPWP